MDVSELSRHFESQTVSRAERYWKG